MTKTGRIITATLLTITTIGLIILGIKTNKKPPLQSKAESRTEQRTTDITNTCWQFKNSFTITETATYYINYIAIDQNNKITEFNRIQFHTNQAIGYVNNDLRAWNYYYNNGTWNNPNAKTIYITGGADIENENFINQLNTIAITINTNYTNKNLIFNNTIIIPNIDNSPANTYNFNFFIVLDNQIKFTKFNINQNNNLAYINDTWTYYYSYGTWTNDKARYIYTEENEITDNKFKLFLAINTTNNPAYTIAYNLGYTAGAEHGYNTGYNDSEAFNHPIALQPLMLNILTMPFTFITQAFDVTLWPNTAYEFNIANFIKGLIAIATILFIIRLFTTGFSIIGNYTGNSQDVKLKKSQIQLNKAKTNLTNRTNPNTKTHINKKG